MLMEDLLTLGDSEAANKSAIDKVRNRWKKRYDADSEEGAVFFNELHQTHLKLIAAYDGLDNPSSVLLLNFQRAFVTDKYTGYDLSKQFPTFLEVHPVLLKEISRLMKLDNQLHLEHPNGLRQGDTGEIIENIFSLYFYHLTSPELAPRADVMKLILPFYSKYADRESELVVSLLETNEDGIQSMAGLIEIALTQQLANEHAVGNRFLDEMISIDSTREDYAHQHAVKILSALLGGPVQWTDEQIEQLVSRLVLQPLELSDGKPEELLLAETTEAIKRFKKLPELKRQSQAKKEQIESGFSAYIESEYQAAAVFYRKSKIRQKTLKLLLDKFGDHQALLPVRRLIQTAENKGSAKQYDVNQKPTIPFADFGFKLLVIEELMYRQELLQPKFDIRAFAKEYEVRDISVDDDGYEVIPEALAYYQDLDIPQSLLEKVATLTSDNGVGGGMEIVNQYHPFWDPGSGDELIHLTPMIVEDLKKTPNLRQITFIGEDRIPDEIEAVFTDASVEVLIDPS